MASNYPTDTEDEWNEGEPEFQLSPPPSQKIVSNFNPVGELQSEFAKLPVKNLLQSEFAKLPVKNLYFCSLHLSATIMLIFNVLVLQ